LSSERPKRDRKPSTPVYTPVEALGDQRGTIAE
jgi:hypothetical protein